MAQRSCLIEGAGLQGSLLALHREPVIAIQVHCLYLRIYADLGSREEESLMTTSLIG